jgi:hypothetical protein
MTYPTPDPKPGSTSGQSTTDPIGEENDQAELPPPNNYLICDRTGFRVSVKEGLKKEWTGKMVRKESWEPRHPQDLNRGRATERERGSPRPEQSDNFITTEVTVEDLG